MSFTATDVNSAANTYIDHFQQSVKENKKAVLHADKQYEDLWTTFMSTSPIDSSEVTKPSSESQLKTHHFDAHTSTLPINTFESFSSHKKTSEKIDSIGLAVLSLRSLKTEKNYYFPDLSKFPAISFQQYYTPFYNLVKEKGQNINSFSFYNLSINLNQFE